MCPLLGVHSNNKLLSRKFCQKCDLEFDKRNIVEKEGKYVHFNALSTEEKIMVLNTKFDVCHEEIGFLFDEMIKINSK